MSFANYAKRQYGFDMNPDTMFNSMIKRLHEYKRQSLKILALIARYADIKNGNMVRRRCHAAHRDLRGQVRPGLLHGLS